MNASLGQLTATRTETVLRALTRATERLRRLEVEEQAAFGEYHAAREACAEERLAVDVELGPGMAASYADWKQRRARGEGRELARADAAEDGWPTSGEG